MYFKLQSDACSGCRFLPTVGLSRIQRRLVDRMHLVRDGRVSRLKKPRVSTPRHCYLSSLPVIIVIILVTIIFALGLALGRLEFSFDMFTFSF